MKKRKKQKVRGKVLKKVVREKRVCWFCGNTKGMERHHIIPVSIGGKYLQNNKVDICDDCHSKLHKLLDPVIQYLVAIIQQLQNGEEHKTLPIGFIRTNHIKGGKKR